MRNFVIIIIALLSCASAMAQNIALNERVPRIRRAEWLGGHIPTQSDFTYMEFIHSRSMPSRRSVERIVEHSRKIPSLNVIIVTKESATVAEAWLTEHMSGGEGVIVQAERIFDRYGVQYAPFGIIIDRKRRALWFGNPRQLDTKTIERLVTRSTKN